MVDEYTVLRGRWRKLGWLLCLAAAPWSAAAGAVYRWVDDAGNVHFSDTPPEGIDSDAVPLDSPHNMLPPVAQPADAARTTPALTDSNAAGEPGIDPGRCRQARIDLAVLNESMPVYLTEDGHYRPAWSGDTYRGERNYVEDAVRAEHVARARQRIRRHCADPDDPSAMAATYNAWVQDEFCRVAQAEYQQASETRSRTPRDELEDLRRKVQERCGS